MTDCIFCKIIAGELPSKQEYSDDKVIVIHDISPNAAVHLLIIPREHIESADTLEDNSPLISHIFTVAKKVAAQMGLVDGYRLITNIGQHGAQSVKHLHVHILGGEQLNTKLN